MFTKKTNIVFIGAGKIAFSFCNALNKAGYNISSIISKKKSSADKLAGKFKIPNSFDNYKSISKEEKIFFLSVPDNEIEKSAAKLSKLNLDFKKSLFVHLSGALNIDELEVLKRKKAHIASFHIMQTFPSKEITDLKKLSAAIETDDKAAEKYLYQLAKDLKLKPFTLKPDKKIYYHLAGVFASNFLIGNLSATKKMFSQTVSNKKDFFSVYEGTINTTLKNAIRKGVSNALSGPVERGDYQTIKKHLSALKKSDKLIFSNYIIQSLQLLNVSKEKNKKLNSGQLKIKKMLNEEFNHLKKLLT